MRRLSPLAVVESAGATLVLAVGTVIETGTGTGGGSGMRGIDVHRHLGGNRRLPARQGIDGRPLGLGRTRQPRAEGDRYQSFELHV